jgi:transcriptional regulator with XRE-family HTH domain
MRIVSQQLLRALRGKRTQQAFARKLGYRANPITDWEHGRRTPTANEALSVAARSGVDVVAAFARFAPTVPLQSDRGVYLLDRWMRQLLGTTSITELSARLGRSRPAVSRWLSGSAKPRLPAFLEFVDAATGRAPDLVAELVPIERVPALKARFDVAQAARRVALERPWTEAILRVLETAQYRALQAHDSDWIARQLGLDAAEIARNLALLCEADVVVERGGKFTEHHALNVDTRGGKEALRGIKAHWLRVAAERALDPQATDLFAYNVCSCSSEDMLRIKDLLRATYQEVRAIVAGSERCDDVGLINLQFMRWPAP